jgi:hypothetical protein
MNASASLFLSLPPQRLPLLLRQQALPRKVWVGEPVDGNEFKNFVGTHTAKIPVMHVS